MEIETKSKRGKKYLRNIQSKYFKVYQLNSDIEQDYESGTPYFKIHEKYGIHAHETKRRAAVYGWVRNLQSYSLVDTLQYIAELKSTRNQGFSAAVKAEDTLMISINTYNNNTEEKITKRCFDLLYPHDTKNCLNCGASLFFSTFDSGYGSYKGKKVCGRCINSKYTRTAGYSKVSQTLFWKLYSSLSPEEKNNCKFAELNGERVVSTKHYCKKKPQINKTQYRLDFVVGLKNIEYDCDRYHTYEKDQIRDVFLTEEKQFEILRINHDDFLSCPEKVIVKCIMFIRS